MMCALVCPMVPCTSHTVWFILMAVISLSFFTQGCFPVLFARPAGFSQSFCEMIIVNYQAVQKIPTAQGCWARFCPFDGVLLSLTVRFSTSEAPRAWHTHRLAVGREQVTGRWVITSEPIAVWAGGSGADVGAGSSVLKVSRAVGSPQLPGAGAEELTAPLILISLIFHICTIRSSHMVGGNVLPGMHCVHSVSSSSLAFTFTLPCPPLVPLS